MQVLHQDSQDRYSPPPPAKTTTDVSLSNYSLRPRSENIGESSMCCVDTAFEAPDVSHVCAMLFVALCFKDRVDVTFQFWV